VGATDLIPPFNVSSCHADFVAMVRVILTDVNGKVHEIADAAAGSSLMEVAKAHDVAGVTADCGGACSCATCHVFIAEEWFARVGQPDDIEFGMLDMVADVAGPTSRLSCQIRLSEELDGLTATVAPSGGF
jgi:ferredoxin, 2Fe-2S